MLPAWFTQTRRLILFALAVATLVLALPAAMQAQEAMVITGRVTDQFDEPIANANVYIDGTSLAAISGDDGRYQLVVPASRVTGAEARLIASLIGYRVSTQTITMTGETLTMDFALALDPIGLDQLVAVGQGLTTERRRLGTNIGNVSSEHIMDSQATNVVNAIAGKVANVYVVQASGEPGAGTYISIRGLAKSVEGTAQPLFVVDGTPINNDTDQTENELAGSTNMNRAGDINPDDVQSVEILKGPAAASIYGAAGANGAVLITTKGGVAGQTQIELRTSYSWDDVNKTVALQREHNRDNSPSSIRSWGNQLACVPNCVLGVDIFDHEREAFKTGNRWDTNLTVTGGSARTTYFVSGGYTDHKGYIVGPSGVKSTKLRVKASHQAIESLGFTGNIAWSGMDGQVVQQGSNTSGLLLPMVRTPPDFNNLPKLDEFGDQRQWFGGFDNPYFIAEDFPNTTDVGRVFGNFRIDWDAISWLTITNIFGGDYANDERLTLFPKGNTSSPDGQLIKATFNESSFDNSFIMTGSATVSPDFTFSVTAGHNYRFESVSNIQTDGFGVVVDAIQLEFATARVPSEFQSDIKTSALFGKATFDIANQLFLQGGVRYEGSSTFGSDQNYFLYPSGSLAWDFTEAIGTGDVISFGKVRFAYGEAGVAPPVFSNVSGFQKTDIDDSWLQNNFLSSFYLGQEGVTSELSGGNPFIDPEKTREYEAGLDLAFLNSRISAGVTYFDQKTTDAILFLPVPESSGFNTQPFNGASWNAKGWEVTLDLIPFQSNDFTWELNTHWASYRSEVTDMLGTNRVPLGNWFTSFGPSAVFNECGLAADEPCPFGAGYGNDFVRFGRGIQTDYDNDGFANDIDEEFPGNAPGTLFIGPDGLPLEDDFQRVLSDPNAIWSAGIRSTFRIVQNLRITGLLDIAHGGDMWNGTKGALFSYGTHAETLVRHCVNGVDCAPGEGERVVFQGDGPGAGQEVFLNTNTAGPSSDFNSFGGPSGASARVLGIDECDIAYGCQFVESAGFVKLRDVSLTYDLTGRWVNAMSLARISVTAVGRNVWTSTSYTGLDPESNLSGQNATRGWEYFNNPQVRSFILQIAFIH
jgi:TonB-linked SusC/RagA family outer membrane protein